MISGLDTVLLMVPFAVFLIMAMFGMDERVSAARARLGRRRKFCEVGRDGRGLLSDPDGKCGNRTGFPPFPSRHSGEFTHGANGINGRGRDASRENKSIILK
jgi:hypothetical protein